LYFFSKNFFFIKDNSVEFHYLKMVDDEMEFDFEEIQKYKIPEIEKS
jgi:para-aminobenzoate synthetase component 1